MPKQIAPLTAARKWAAEHPALEAHIFVRRWGKHGRLWSEYYAARGHVDTDHHAGVCRNCGHVFFNRASFQEHCPDCQSAGTLGYTYAYGAAAYIVEIDTCKETPTVCAVERPAAQAA